MTQEVAVKVPTPFPCRWGLTTRPDCHRFGGRGWDARGNAPLSVVMRQPDYRIMVWVAVVLLGWGLVRTVLLASGPLRAPRAVGTGS